MHYFHRFALPCACAVVACWGDVSLVRGEEPSARNAEPLEPIAAYEHLAGPLLTKYCSDCHAGDEVESGLRIEKLRGGDEFQTDRRQWIDVLRHLRAGDMPPVDNPQPTTGEREQLIDWIAAKLKLVDCTGEVNPGRVTVRRLNRDNYKNTVQDLLGVDFDPTELFPPDELAYGFDNNGDVLGISPLLLEKYLDAGQQVAEKAIAAPEQLATNSQRLNLKKSEGIYLSSKSSALLYTNSRLECSFAPQQDGRYAARVLVSGEQAGDELVRMVLYVGKRKAKEVEVNSDGDDEELFVVSFDAKQEQSVNFSVAFVNDYYQEYGGGKKRDRNLMVHEVKIIGPFDPAAESTPRAGHLLLATRPTPAEWHQDGAWQATCRQPLKQFARRALRQDVGDAYVDRLLALLETSRQAGDSYERAVQHMVATVLSSPRFLLIGDLDGASKADGIEPIDDFTLASRLSYFLWGSMPDDELLDLASRGELRGQLDKQARRMLRNPRVRNFANSFSGQWLETRRLAEFRPDPATFPEFDDELRAAMRGETERFFAAVVVEDLPIQTLLAADFTYLNERLANHYGIDDVTGNYFRRVSLAGETKSQGRGGLLGLASVLAVTSNPDRTSPVLRGKFVMANLLGDEPPPPPADVPSLVEEGKAVTGTVRQRLEAHRDNPGCASCHNQFDPLGFALEKFDALGRFRELDAGQPVDDSAKLPDGTEFTGAAGLQQLLLERDEMFRRALTEKMLTYALGRGLEYYDECSVRDIVDQTSGDESRFSDLVLAVVNSRPFLYENRSANPQESME